MALSDTPVIQLAEQLRRRFGFNFAGARLEVLVDGLRRLHPDLNEAAGQLLKSDRARLADFVGKLTNTETYFFRHGDHFEALRTLAPRRAAATRAPVFRVWSAGCSTGEEPLSLAAALLDALPPTVTLAITATDINPLALERATGARYTEWSFRGVPPDVRQRWFRREADGWRPREALQRAIAFRRHNLLEGAPEPVPFDLVVCRNVLIYFEPDEFHRAVNALSLAVAPGGLLVLGPTETAAAQLPDFDVVHQYGCLVHLKRDRFATVELAPAAAPRPSAPLAAVPPVAPAPPVATAPPPVAAPVGTDLERARSLADQGRLEEARAVIAASQAANGDSGEAHLLLALVALEARQPRVATTELEAAVSRDPSLALGHYLLGMLLEESGNEVGAQGAWQHALEALVGLPLDAPVRAAGGLRVGELVRTLDLSLRRGRSEGAA